MNMNKVSCSDCGSNATVERGSYEFKECGLSAVVLHGIEIIHCPECGNDDPIIPAVNDLMRLLAVAVIGKPERLAGEEIRFLRKYLRKTGGEFARLLSIDKTHLSKLENDADPISNQTDRLVRMIVLALGDGLSEKLDEIVRDFLNIRHTKTKKSRRVPIEVDTAKMTYQYA